MEAVSDAVEKVKERIAVVEEQSTTSRSPSIREASTAETDKFDDMALQNLFVPLIHRRSPTSLEFINGRQAKPAPGRAATSNEAK
jgi:hypothetical protein